MFYKVVIGMKMIVAEYPNVIYTVTKIFKNGNLNLVDEFGKTYRITKKSRSKFQRYMDESFINKVEEILLRKNCCMSVKQLSYFLIREKIIFTQSWLLKITEYSDNIVYEKNEGLKHVKCTVNKNYEYVRRYKKKVYYNYCRDMKNFCGEIVY